MAKMRGLVGSGSGKAGNFVFSKGMNGETIVRAYQPQVLNPKTYKQNLQRAKMVLAGGISSITPAGALSALGYSGKLRNRSRYVQGILRAAVAESAAGGKYVATIEPDLLSFGRGMQPLLGIAGSVVVTSTSVTVPVTVTPGTNEGKYGERIIVMVVDKSSSPAYKAISYVDHLFAAPVSPATSVTESIVVDVPTLEVGQAVAIYRVPFVLTDEARSIYGDGWGWDDDKLTASLAVNNSAVSAWGNSVMEGQLRPFTV